MAGTWLGTELSNSGGKNDIFFVRFSDRLSGTPTSLRSASSSPGTCFAAPADDFGLLGGSNSVCIGERCRLLLPV